MTRKRESIKPSQPTARAVPASGTRFVRVQRWTSPNLLQVRQQAEQMMTAFGLTGWTFRFNRRKCSMGMCYYEKRIIELSSHFVQQNDDDEIRDTILHEIAHALVGSGHGHDSLWKRQCLAIGARPLRCGNANMPLGRWRAECVGCQRHFHRHRKPHRMRGWFCLACGRERGKLIWRLHA